jgi:hypothetical protein
MVSYLGKVVFMVANIYDENDMVGFVLGDPDLPDDIRAKQLCNAAMLSTDISPDSILFERSNGRGCRRKIDFKIKINDNIYDGICA